MYPWSSLVEGDEQQDRSIGKSTCEPAEKKIFYLHGLSSLLLRGPMLLFNSFYYLKCSMAQSFKQHRLAYSLSLSLSCSFSQISRDHLTPHYPKLVVNIPHLVGVRPTQTGWSRTFKWPKFNINLIGGFHLFVWAYHFMLRNYCYWFMTTMTSVTRLGVLWKFLAINSHSKVAPKHWWLLGYFECKNCCGYYFGNFSKHLGHFLI